MKNNVKTIESLNQRTNFERLKSKNKIPYPVGYRMTETMNIIKDMAIRIQALFPVKLLPMNGPEKPKLVFCVRGSSGAILAGLITPFLTDYEIVINHIKKQGESSHNDDKPLYLPNEWPWIILDDFILSGETVNEIYKDMCRAHVNCKVDCLCVSGFFNQSDINFKPINVIAGGYNRSL